MEEQVSTERARIYRQLEAKRVAKGKSLLRKLQDTLARKGTEVIGLFVQFEEPLTKKAVVRAILQTARKQGCGTIVVGRHCFSGWQRLFRGHVGEELVREGKGTTIWVVEC
jgi:nucleotide-binding universal stress UspA family protein